MSDAQELCSICNKPKNMTGSASITQWIALCGCDAVENSSPTSSNENLSQCETCGKRIGEENKGSFTQFIFRTEYCRCKIPRIKIDRKFDFYTREEIEEELIEDSDEITVSPDLYPSDRYKPLRLLGEGSVGAVYLCKDEFLSKNVTLKLLKSIQLERLIEFQEEAKATSRLNHPSIIKILDFGISIQETPYMVLEYFRGQSLEEYLKTNGPLNWLEAIAITIEVSGALAYSHTLGIFHRDVKPSNILIRIENEFPVVKVIDFGLAKAVDEQSELNKNKNLFGTPTYMSPEIVNGGKYDARSEIYSLACILYELITSDQPFRGENILSTLDMQLNSPVPKVSERFEITEELERVIEKALSKNADDRYSDMGEFRQALEQCYQSSGIHIESESKQLELAPRSGNPVFLMVVLTVSVIGLLGLFFFLGNKVLFNSVPIRHSASASKKKVEKRKFEDYFSLEDTGSYLKIYSDRKIVDEDLKLIRKVSARAIRSRKPIHLNFNGHELDGSGLKYLDGLPIRSLTLDSNSLKKENLKYLSRMKTIIDFDLRHVNNATDIFIVVMNLPKIGKVNFGGSRIGDDAFEVVSKNKTIHHLFVSGTGIGDQAIQYISKAKTIRSLAIADNDDITLKGFLALTVLPNLEFLDVNQLSNFNGQALKIASRYKSLQNIHLTGAGKFKPKSLLYLNRCRKIRKIGVYDLRPMSKFMPYIAKLKRVKDLIVTDTDITDNDLRYILEMKGLKNLTIAAAPHITKEGLGKFRKELPPSVAFHSGVETIEDNIGDISELLQ